MSFSHNNNSRLCSRGVRIVNKKIIFFGDFGIDDAVALIYANKTCKLDILGIVAEYG
ncbi:nucleoside hydrolase, partial [Bacillus cereus]|nr:nucleoside hydrolase [Bacillus cereus]